MATIVDEDDFASACAYVRSAAARLQKSDLLYFYARFKQVTEGDCCSEKPPFYQMTERSKWAAWTDLKSMNKEEARIQYIDR